MAKDVQITDGVGRVIIANADQLTVEHLKSLLLADVGEVKPTQQMAEGEGGGGLTPTAAATPEKQAQIDELLKLLSDLLHADLGTEMKKLADAVKEATDVNKEILKKKEEKLAEKKAGKDEDKPEEPATAPKDEKMPPTMLASTGMEQVVAALQNLGGLSEACCSRLIEAIKSLMPANVAEAATKTEAALAASCVTSAMGLAVGAKGKAAPVNEPAQTGVAEANKAAIQPQIDITSIKPEITGIAEAKVDLGGKPGAVTRVIKGAFDKHKSKSLTIKPTITIKSIEPIFQPVKEGMVKTDELGKMIEDSLATSAISVTKLPVNVLSLDINLKQTAEKPNVPPITLNDITELPIKVDSLKVEFAQKAVTPTAVPPVETENIPRLPVKVDGIKLVFDKKTETPSAVPPIKIEEVINELPVTVKSLKITLPKVDNKDLPKIDIKQEIDVMPVTVKRIDVKFAEKLTDKDMPKIDIKEEIDEMPVTVKSLKLVGVPDVSGIQKQIQELLSKVTVPETKLVNNVTLSENTKRQIQTDSRDSSILTM